MPVAARNTIGSDAQSITMRSSAILMFFWLLYPIAWGLSEGGNVITEEGEMIFYGVLDVLMAVTFLFFHLFSVSAIEFSRLTFGTVNYQVTASEKVDTA